jgi:microcompartment protein CcmL/EutN
MEVQSFAGAVLALDAIDKAADVTVIEAELNDYYGIVIKFTGSPASIEDALAVAKRIIEPMHVPYALDGINRPTTATWRLARGPEEYQPLIEQLVVFHPSEAATQEGNTMSRQHFAIGLIETQGFTAAIEAIDTACKAANVEVIGKEKLGGGYVTIVIRGDVAAVEAAVAAGRAKVDTLGKLIAAHIIPRPGDAVLGLITKLQ